MEFHWVHNRMKNCRHDRIPLYLKEFKKIFPCVQPRRQPATGTIKKITEIVIKKITEIAVKYLRSAGICSTQWTGRKIPIGCTAVREICRLSGHHGRPIEGHVNTTGTS